MEETSRVQQSEIRSAEVQEIIGQTPSAIVRWGLLIIFFVMVGLLSLTWFIKYPDLLKATVTLTTDPPPVVLVSQASGKLILLKREGDDIADNELIAYIHSNAVPDLVLKLEKTLLSNETTFGRGEGLGDLQTTYNALLTAQQALNNFMANKTYDLQIDQLTKQLNTQQKLSGSLRQQEELTAQELALAKQRFATDSLLFAQKVTAPLDFNTAKTTWLQQQRSAKNAEAALLNNEAQRNELEQQIADLQIQKSEKQDALKLTMQSNRQTLLAQIAKWKEQYLFIVPKQGTLAYLGFLESELFVQVSKPLFSITPPYSTITARAQLPVAGSGKVKEGQQVNIRLDNYPAEQFGMLKGTVTSISTLPNENHYLLTIALPQELVTTQKKKLAFRQQISGTTEIVTEDLRLLERFFYQFRKLLRVR